MERRTWTSIIRPAQRPISRSAGCPTVQYNALADDSTTWSGLTIRLKETNVNQDNCKSATANITYTANAGV